MLLTSPDGLARKKQEGSVSQLPHITVCICTFKRPSLLRRLLDNVVEQKTDGLFSLSLVIVDNDVLESARQVVESFAGQTSVEVTYCVEPRQNIALARNKAVENSKGDYIAFIDDDEFPVREWLLNLLVVCRNYGAAGALGPVRPHFTQTPPPWLLKGKFAERVMYSTGHVMDWRKSRTGNLLVTKALLVTSEDTFRPQFGTGGEDIDFFERMAQKGCKFVWCNEAEVFEEVPPDRCTRKYHLRRALLRGKNSFEREGIQISSLGKSLLAVSMYGCAFPFLFVMGQHHLMKYAIKFFDHAGKLLTPLGLNPVKER